ncbi:MAG: ABC transporter permease [Bacteroidetes bacterium]|nr:ABC transporter permease [Bacteroidota bacterium]MCB0841933.1 ABC transporter permease [Bacteroidota bacterium]
MGAILTLGEFGYLIWRLITNLQFVFRDRNRVTYQLDHVGVNSIPLVLLIGLFSGAIIAWQAAYQFKGMISLNVLGGQVVRVILMEMAPVLTALVISGRIGASMTAEIGSMKITEQIDALRTMSIDPVRYIVLPRFIGLTFMMPILTLFSILIAVLGAFLVSNYFLDITYEVFFHSVRDFFAVSDLAGGLIKATIFGMTIALIGCFMGLKTDGGAVGLGQSTIQSFVICAISILAGDFLLWIILF